MKSFLPTGERFIAAVVVFTRLCFCWYRARDQAITIDEALSFHNFIEGSWNSFYHPFDANNHVLYSILAKLSCAIFDVSELSLRLPSLIAGAVLLWLAFEILEQIVNSPVFRWLAFLAVALHPLLLDFCIAARGYSLSIAMLLFCVWLLLRKSADFTHAGICLGLGIAANFSAVFPAIALAIAAPLCLEPQNRWRSFRRIAGSALLVAAAICFLSLRSATRAHFYAGYPDAVSALESYAYTSIHARPDDPGFMGTREAAHILAFWLLPLTVILLAAEAGYRSVSLKSPRDALFIAVALLTAIGFVSAHLLFNTPYPPDRACLFFIPFLAFAWASSCSRLSFRLLQPAQAGFAAILIAQFATQLHGSYFQFWSGEVDDKRMVELLTRETKHCPESSITIRGDLIYLPTLEFYRKIRGIRALKPVAVEEYPTLTGADFYAVQNANRDTVRRAGMRILHENRMVDSLLLSGSTTPCLAHE